ncbi:MAG: tetratricopeptide repeat protein [Coriobacteriia bacterium]|nr:tetratricopeptide repeat protein [Coriobacteriia bacterium]
MRRARGSEIPRQAQRVFLSWDEDNKRMREQLIEAVLSRDAGADCVVSWTESPWDTSDLEGLENELHETQLLILLVTPQFLARPAADIPPEYTHAKHLQLPVLPVVLSEELLSQFSKQEGAIHGISVTDPEFRQKLKEQLSGFIVSNELAQQIMDEAFAATIFLSYRKKDVVHARDFMKAFHDVPGFESVAIWYDNFLTAGRVFDVEICESIDKADAFALLVTPHISEPGNYVITEEYPYAVKQGKRIVSVEAVETDMDEYHVLFSQTERRWDVIDQESLQAVFTAALGSALKTSYNCERTYLLALAYLGNLGVERDRDRAIELLGIAAKGRGLTDAHALDLKTAVKAAKQLAAIYEDPLNRENNSLNELYWRKQVMELTAKAYGDPSEDMAEAMLDMCLTYRHLQRFEAAYELYGKAIRMEKEVIGYNHIDTLNSFAMFLMEMGVPGQAARIFELILKRYEQPQETAPQGVANVYNNMAATCLSSGDYDKGLEWALQAVEHNERVLGPDDPATATSYSTLGTAYSALGQHVKALDYAERAWQCYKESYGEDSPHTVVFTLNAASAYRMVGNWERALELTRQALRTAEMTLAKDHQYIAGAYVGLGETLLAQAEETEDTSLHSEAKGCFDRALAIYERTHGEDHEETAKTYARKAGILFVEQEYQQALDLAAKAYRVFHESDEVGENHPQMQFVSKLLGYLFEMADGDEKRLARWLLEPTGQLRFD